MVDQYYNSNQNTGVARNEVLSPKSLGSNSWLAAGIIRYFCPLVTDENAEVYISTALSQETSGSIYGVSTYIL